MYVKVNKAWLRSEVKIRFFDDEIFGMALDSFLSGPSDAMPAKMYAALVGEYSFDPEKLTAAEPAAIPTPEWSATIEVVGDRMKMTVSHNGEELVYGKSYVQDTDDLGMMQAISYAAHMCYKMVQQKSM